MATGESAPRRQGAVPIGTAASEVNPVLVGGRFLSGYTSLEDGQAAMLRTDEYGRAVLMTETTLLQMDVLWSMQRELQAIRKHLQSITGESFVEG
jgi:hypothetical protein